MDLISHLVISVIISLYFSSGVAFGKVHVYNVFRYGAHGDGKTDDSQAFLKAWADLCQDDGTQGVPTLLLPKATFLLQPLEFTGPCKSSNVLFQMFGNIAAPDSIQAWGSCNIDRWISFQYIDGLTVAGQGGLIDGRGSIWWGEEMNKCNKPTALFFHSCNNLHIRRLRTLNTPRSHISIVNCNGVSIYKISLTAPWNSPNTDGIDISASTQIYIDESIIATGDDCVAINGGCSDITITKLECGPGHGISVGSLGRNGANDTVQDIRVRNCTFTGTQNGARIKTVPGGRGYAERISFDKIKLVNTENPIIIDQQYCPRKNCPPETQPTAVRINNVTFSNFEGTSASKDAIRLMCSKVIGCTNVQLDYVDITSAKSGSVLQSNCANVQGTSNTVTPQVKCLSW